MFSIDIRNPKPVYEQLYDNIEKLILSGVLKGDEALPSIRNLAIELSVNPNTIQRAYSKLEDNGLIYSVKGRGSFVSSNNQVIIDKKINSIKLKIKELINDAMDIGVSIDEIKDWFKGEDL